MVSFAKARTRSLLSRLWPMKVQSINFDKVDLDESRELIDKQNNCLLEASKNGGIWFS